MPPAPVRGEAAGTGPAAAAAAPVPQLLVHVHPLRTVPLAGGFADADEPPVALLQAPGWGADQLPVPVAPPLEAAEALG